jgi:hypothetical protein
VAKEEYEIEETPVEQILTHFKKSIEEGELAAKLAHYHELCTELTAMEASKEALRKEILEAGRGEESISAGGYAAFFKKVSGRVSTDWKRAYRDAVGEMTSDEAEKYITKGEDTVRVEVKRIGS